MIFSFLVELCPARIRYTSLSAPYHLGVGVLGGLLPRLLLHRWCAGPAIISPASCISDVVVGCRSGGLSNLHQGADPSGKNLGWGGRRAASLVCAGDATFHLPAIGEALGGPVPDLWRSAHRQPLGRFLLRH